MQHLQRGSPQENLKQAHAGHFFFNGISNDDHFQFGATDQAATSTALG